MNCEKQEATTPSLMPQTMIFFECISNVIHTIAGAAVTIEASRTLAGELGRLSSSANSVGVTAVSSSETWVLCWLSS